MAEAIQSLGLCHTNTPVQGSLSPFIAQFKHPFFKKSPGTFLHPTEPRSQPSL
jgi:hypothetical protein